jgi:DMSO reductase family type II enzyme chaperone
MLIPSKDKTIVSATARSFVYRFLAHAYEYPEPKGWGWMCHPDTRQTLISAVRSSFAPSGAKMIDLAHELDQRLLPDNLDVFLSEYHSAFGHTARGSCPLNEIEYGDLKADPLFQPHRLADLAAFYRAFGLEMTDDAAERQDHFSIECEFMSVLGAKEAYAIAQDLKNESVSLCQDAQKKFLKEHLARWSSAFTNRLSRIVGEGPLGAIAQFTNEFIKLDCASRGVIPGSEDLLLRPIDEAEESMCASCGIHSLPPGATAPLAEETP